MKEKLIYSAKEGYNIIAEYYDNWKWQRFWNNNEYPIIESWCKSLPIGYGLDAGAGSGNNLNCFLKAGHKVTAVDISSEMLKICYKKNLDFVKFGLLECQEFDIQKFIYSRKKYDWLICNRVLSHIKEIDVVFRIFSNLLKNNGQCFISNVHPNHNYDNTGINYENKKLYIETHKHTIENVKECIYKFNFEIIEFREVGISELKNKLSITEFPELFKQISPIFYYCILKSK